MMKQMMMLKIYLEFEPQAKSKYFELVFCGRPKLSKRKYWKFAFLIRKSWQQTKEKENRMNILFFPNFSGSHGLPKKEEIGKSKLGLVDYMESLSKLESATIRSLLGLYKGCSFAARLARTC